jgi:hypothetical protein
LFDVSLSPADAAAFHFQAGYGPVPSTGTIVTPVFQNVATSMGPLTFTTSGDVTFFSSVPEPSTWALMLVGFAGLGIAGYRQTRKGAESHVTLL